MSNFYLINAMYFFQLNTYSWALKTKDVAMDMKKLVDATSKP
jgi:hypothetical protein